MENPPPDTPAAWLRTALGSTDPEASIEAIQLLTARLGQAESDAVAMMRLHGASWQQIADTTGMNSRQAAQNRYGTATAVDALALAAGRAPRP